VKWVGLFLVLAAIVPVSRWVRQNPSEAPKLWMLMGFLPFALSFVHLNMALISWLNWPGYVKGAEFSVLDGLAIALYLSLPRSRHPLPFRFSMALYLFATVLSAVQAAEPTAALFYTWQVARVFLVYATVARGSSVDPRVPFAILKGMAAALIVEVVVAAWQRFGEGMLQAPGTVYHQNLLGMMTHFVALPIFALLLSGPAGWMVIAAPIGIVIDVLTVSRGVLGFALVGFVTILILSILRKWTARKRTVLALAALSALLLSPVAISSFENRLSNQAAIASSDDERAIFERAARMMLSDNPLGQGANHYVMAANLKGYNQRAGVPTDTSNEGANVHNVYYLIAAETGYPGLITFLLLLLRPMTVAFLCGWNSRGDQRGDLLIGLGAGLLIVYIHSLFEWIFVFLETQYLFALNIGLVAGLATQLGYWSRPQRQANAIGLARLPTSSPPGLVGALKRSEVD
jgi:O-antigen ligase